MFCGSGSTLKCNRRELLNVIKPLSTVTKKHSNQSLECVCIERAGTTVHIMATNLDVSMLYTTTCDAGDNYKMVIKCDNLKQFLSDDRGENVLISMSEKGIAIAQTESNDGRIVGTVRLPTIPSDVYPILPESLDMADGGTNVDGAELQRIIKAVIPAAASQSIKYALTGVSIIQSGCTMEIACTDTHRLHVGTIFANSPADIKAVALLNTMAAISNVCGDAQTYIKIDDKTVSARCGNWTIQGIQIQGTFPSYSPIIGGAMSAPGCLWHKEDAIKAFKAVAPFSDKDKAITVAYSPSGIFKLASSWEEGSAESSFSMEETCPYADVEIKLSAQYITEALAIGKAEKAEVRIKDARLPVAIQCDHALIAIIMPVSQ